MLERKNTQEKKYVLGQFFTPFDICERLVSGINFNNALIIEPSFGTGNFLRSLRNVPSEKIGLELDRDIFSNAFADENTKLFNKNFYDFSIQTKKKVVFVGNPPFRTPAYSLSTHKEYLSKLTKKYDVPGIREEAIFFILHSIEIIRANGGHGEIHYIIPTSLLKNNSKFYIKFKEFLKKHTTFLKISSIEGTEFEGVMQDLVFVSLEVKPNTLFLEKVKYTSNDRQQKTVSIDNKETVLDEYLCLVNNDSIPFQKIFKKTYLGSVPCESLLMSVANEGREEFRSRIFSIISDKKITKDKLYQKLQFKGRFHLKVFDAPKDSNMVQDKLEKILSYVKNIQEKDGILEEFLNIENYKEINVRAGIRYYFRCEKLKKKKNFVYELNPNPCKSFYFTGNPSHSSTDYLGFCDYDCNRNVSPGANRTVPVEGIEDNVTDSFKEWWRDNTDEPIQEVFNYLMFVAKTNWYKEKKKRNKRLYFAIPSEFISREKRYNKENSLSQVKSNQVLNDSVSSQLLF